MRASVFLWARMSDNATVADGEQAALENIAGGVSRFSTGDTSVEAMDPLKQLQALDKLEERTARDVASTKPHFGLRFTKLISPGGGFA